MFRATIGAFIAHGRTREQAASRVRFVLCRRPVAILGIPPIYRGRSYSWSSPGMAGITEPAIVTFEIAPAAAIYYRILHGQRPTLYGE